MSRLTTPASFEAMLFQDGHHDPVAFEFVTSQLFDGISLAGTRALEIGSGRGLQAIYMAQRGAIVTSLEPEAIGSTGGVLATQRARCQELGLAVDVINADFNSWDTELRFDVILSRASINHLYATTQHALRDHGTHDRYVAILRHIRELLSPSGVFIATDASRYSFFALTRKRKWIRRPWTKHRLGINWRHHQTPFTWRRLLREAGFSSVTIDYPVPYKLRSIAPLVNTAAASFWLEGAFLLRARK